MTQDSTVYNHTTKHFNLCCDAGIPVGVDDPHSKGDINKLLIDLYNEGKGAIQWEEVSVHHPQPLSLQATSHQLIKEGQYNKLFSYIIVLW